MARNIQDSVGRAGGRNRPTDVVTVQELLDQVPAGGGGPVPLLVVDGLCGPKTIRAIQRFQLHHFGFRGADGRVDPNQRTLAKLNEFDRGGRFPRPAPPPVRALTLRMSCPHNGRITATSATSPIVTTSDTFAVSGCNFPTPCTQVVWHAPAGVVVTPVTRGSCLNAGQVVQGRVIFVR